MRFILYTVTALLLAGSTGVPKAGAIDENAIPKEQSKVVPAAEATGYVQVPPPSERALSYYHSGNVLWLINTAWGILIPGLFLFTGLSAERGFPDTLVYCVWSVTMIPPALWALARIGWRLERDLCRRSAAAAGHRRSDPRQSGAGAGRGGRRSCRRRRGRDWRPSDQ